MLERIEVDTHTHTIISGHAWSTLRENARAGREAGLKGLCLTEHGYRMDESGPHYLTAAQRMLPPELEGLAMFYGIEANIMDLEGNIDITGRYLHSSAWTIASMHPECMTSGTTAENTEAYFRVLANPGVDMLGHIDDRRMDSDFDAVTREAARLGKVIEINNNSLKNRVGSIPRVEAIAAACARHGTWVAVSSDAHFDTMVGAVAPSLELLNRVGFPEELVVNRTLAVFQHYMELRKARLAEAEPFSM